MSQNPFSEARRTAARNRAATLGPELFLLDRAFDDVTDRVEAMIRPIANALMIGCPSRAWHDEVSRLANTVEVIEPGHSFAATAGAEPIAEADAKLGERRFDVAIAVGTLDTVNALPHVLRHISRSLRVGAPLIGAMAGGNGLPALRSALIEGERGEGAIRQHVHPRIDAPTLAGLLTAAGFEQCVVDVDRVKVRYPSLSALARDLRAMGASNQLAHVARLSPTALVKAESAFQAGAVNGKTQETFEILHFAGWAAEARQTLR